MRRKQMGSKTNKELLIFVKKLANFQKIMIKL